MIDVVGIGAAGWESLPETERELVRNAAFVVGSRRQLDLIPAIPGQQRTTWPSDLRGAASELLAAHARRPTVVLASGDPLVAGVGSILVDLFGIGQVRIHPAVSSVALARARMGWADESAEVIRLRGDDVDLIRRSIEPGRRLIVLARDHRTPTEVAEVLVASGFGASRLTVLGELGAPTESRVETIASAGSFDAPALHVLCVECVSPPTAAGSLAPGLPDAAYENDGQLTKRDVRASALAHLQPRPGELLWDLGAGAGSVGIEWMRSHPTCRAVAVERDPERAARITRNARALGVPGLDVRVRPATELADLPDPGAVFVGGGATDELLEQSWDRLPEGGRLVAHAVTYETEAVLAAGWRAHGGDLTRITVEHLDPIGGFHGWRPARAVVQWSAVKGGDPS